MKGITNILTTNAIAGLLNRKNSIDAAEALLCKLFNLLLNKNKLNDQINQTYYYNFSVNLVV